jgi:hypothetical protein
MMQALAVVIVIHAGGLLADPGDGSLREQTIVVSDGKIASVEEGNPRRATALKRGWSTSKIASCCPV